MPVSSFPCRTGRLAPCRRSIHESAARHLARISLAAMLVTAGCQAPDVIESPTPLPKEVAGNDLVRFAKRDFQACTASFYKDDWRKMAEASTRLLEVARRFQEQPKPIGKEKEYSDNASGLADVAKELAAAAAKKDVVQTTLLLRRAAAHIAMLEKLT